MPKAIIYCRKSTEGEEKQVQSIEAQLDWCREYATRGGFEIIKEITEDKSAKKPGREGFNELMGFFSEKKADIIISWKLNRLSRNPIDEGTIKWLTQQFIIKEIHTVDGISNGHNILLMSVHFGMATQFLVDLSKDIKRGVAQKAKNGGWGRRTPLGYKMDNGEMVLDQEYAPYVKEVFRLKYEEKLNNAEIARRVTEMGLRTKKQKRKGEIIGGKPITHKVIGVMLKNPLYYGVVHYLGEIFEGKHPPLVEKRIWDEINSKETKKYNFVKKGVLKGKVKFVDTSKKTCVTEKVKKIKSTGETRKYIYYHTAGDNQQWFSENKIIEAFDKNIQDYSVPEKYSGEIRTALFDYHNSKIEENYKGKEEMRKLIDKLEEKKKNYADMRADGELTHEEFVEYKNGLTNEIIDLRERMKNIDRCDAETLEKLSESVELLVNLCQTWKGLNYNQKVYMVDCLTVELKIGKEKGLFIEEKPLFQFIKKCNCSNWWSL